jgi:hypothetical protein
MLKVSSSQVYLISRYEQGANVILSRGRKNNFQGKKIKSLNENRYGKRWLIKRAEGKPRGRST